MVGWKLKRGKVKKFGMYCGGHTQSFGFPKSSKIINYGGECSSRRLEAVGKVNQIQKKLTCEKVVKSYINHLKK